MTQAPAGDRDLPTGQSGERSAPRVAVLLCTYNEIANIPPLLRRVGEAVPEADILVVDDNSPDGTSDEVRRHVAQFHGRLHLLERSGKLGLGSATRDGLVWCLERGYEFIVNLDSDLSHDPAAIPRLLSACVESPPGADVAVGSRYIPGGGIEGFEWHRRWISRVLNGYATRVLRLPVHDCSGSFRCYRATALARLDFDRLTCPGYGFLEELLVALHRNGARLVEVPIHFHARSGGESKLGISDALGALAVIHRLAICR